MNGGGSLSNSSRHWVFSSGVVAVFSAAIRVGKPEPRLFRAALGEVAPDHAVMIGDGLDTDMRGAACLGIPAILTRLPGGSQGLGLFELLEASEAEAATSRRPQSDAIAESG